MSIEYWWGNQTDQLVKKIEEQKEPWNKKLVSVLDVLGDKALDNMKTSIEKINGWSDENTKSFMKNVEFKVNGEKDYLQNITYKPSVEWLLNLATINPEKLDDLIDTGWTDISWLNNLSDKDDRKDVLTKIFDWDNIA